MCKKDRWKECHRRARPGRPLARNLFRTDSTITTPVTNGWRVAMFADDSAIPALHSLLRQWPSGAIGVGRIATDVADAPGALPRISGLQLHRPPLHSNPANALLYQARQLPNTAGHVVWGAGERKGMRAMRHHFQTNVGRTKQDIAIAGYWKRGASNTEINAQRMAAYQNVIAPGGTLADWDNLAVPM